MEPGIKILIQRWEGIKAASAHLSSADIIRFAKDTDNTPDGAPAVVPLTDEKVLQGLMNHTNGCWLTKE